MNEEFDALNLAQQTAVRAAVKMAGKAKVRASINTADGGEAYAYPHPGGGIAWGFNAGETGFCIARGVEC